VLGRLEDFKESDRRVLEAAAVAGLCLQIKTLRNHSQGD
jgi:hypothetical protein